MNPGADIYIREGDVVGKHVVEIPDPFRFLDEFEQKCGGPVPQPKRDKRWLELQAAKARA